MASSPEDTLIGQTVGRFRLLRLLGEGGMSSVYLGERSDEFRQVAAVKLMREGLHDPETRGRFRAEQQVLAVLQHSHIVSLIDGGITPDGTPYLVMDYVDGVALDRFCDDQRLSREQRIELMIRILDAVEYAHQRFVAHCDLKFTNVLVTADGEPRLVDFGVTKLLKPTMFELGYGVTRSGRPFTAEFASPEQLQGKSLTTATDIYSAGVMLYALLTGSHPFEPVRNQPVALMRATLHDEPELPSSRAKERGLSRDLDAIVMKALRKDPGERYASAAQFAADLRNVLTGLPVQARGGSTRYYVWKYIQRNRVAFVAAALLIVAAIGGTAGVVWQGVKAQRSRAQAKERFDEVRMVTNTLLFDFYRGVEDLPGAEDARASLVKWSVGTLDTLARDGGNDPGLLAELADTYRRLGDLHTNDCAKAFERGKHLIDQVVARDPQNASAARVQQALRASEARGCAAKTRIVTR